MMGITGAVLVYAHDIEHLLGQGDPPARTAGDWRTPAELIEAARAASNDPTRIPIAVRWPVDAGRARGGAPVAARHGERAAAVPRRRAGRAGSRRGGHNSKRPATAAGPAQGRVPTQSPFAGSLQLLFDPVSLEILADRSRR